jgi:Ca2+-binding EF-hand superfamily protein
MHLSPTIRIAAWVFAFALNCVQTAEAVRHAGEALSNMTATGEDSSSVWAARQLTARTEVEVHKKSSHSSKVVTTLKPEDTVEVMGVTRYVDGHERVKVGKIVSAKVQPLGWVTQSTATGDIFFDDNTRKAKEIFDTADASTLSADEKQAMCSRKTLLKLRETLASTFDVNGVSLEQQFRAFDRNGDGNIELEEFTTGLQDLGAQVSDQEIKNIMTLLDKDKSGVVSFFEFDLWFGAGPPPPPPADAYASAHTRKSFKQNFDRGTIGFKQHIWVLSCIKFTEI